MHTGRPESEQQRKFGECVFTEFHFVFFFFESSRERETPVESKMIHIIMDDTCVSFVILRNVKFITVSEEGVKREIQYVS